MTVRVERVLRVPRVTLLEEERMVAKKARPEARPEARTEASPEASPEARTEARARRAQRELKAERLVNQRNHQ